MKHKFFPKKPAGRRLFTFGEYSGKNKDPVPDGSCQVFLDMFDDLVVIGTISEMPAITKDDVILFPGGRDINPIIYGAPRNKWTQSPSGWRDACEVYVWTLAQRVGAGCLGICRGAQLVTALAGGILVQDTTGHGGNHMGSVIDANGLDVEQIQVTSTHHQMMYPFDMPVANYQILMKSAVKLSSRYENGNGDGMILPPNFVEPEVVWYPKVRALGIQGHPEYCNEKHPFVEYSRDLVQKYFIQ